MSKRSDMKFTRATLMLQPLTTEFARRGGDTETVLARHEIPVDALTDPTMLVEASACYAAIEDMADSLRNQYFSAEVARRVAIMGTPAYQQAASEATTLGGFLSRVIVEIATQVDNVHYQLSVTSEAAIFEIFRKVKVAWPTPQLDAIGVTLYVEMIRRGLAAKFDPKRIIVTAPSNSGIPPGFLPRRSFIRSGINGLRFVFPPEWLWAPFSLKWEKSEASRGQFGRDDAGPLTLSYFGRVLREKIGHHDLSLDLFAEICGQHPRRVQRILKSQGTSYRQMKDDVRRSVAEDLLTNTSIPIAQIAIQVGLSGPPALDRAFRQWTGKTPTRFRTEASQNRDA